MSAIRVVEYDPAWPQLFQELKAEIEWLLGDMSPDVHHIGSTSVPGLAAKPKIDADAIIAGNALPEAIDLVKASGFTFHGDPYRESRWIFTRNHAAHGFRLYLCSPDNPAHRDRMLFRDYLRSHRERAAEYQSLKRRLAAGANGDWDFYTGGKSEFVRETLRLASSEAAQPSFRA